MKIMAKPYKISPYHDLLEKGYPWVEEMRSVVTCGIDDIMDKMRTEAEYEGQPELLNEDFLYERFKENCEHGLRFANWQVLKYFSRLLVLKIWKDAVGEWTFTRHDEEMFKYFSMMDVDKETKCYPRYLNFKTCEYYYKDIGTRKPLIPIYIPNHKYVFKFIENNKNYGKSMETEAYVNLFVDNLYAINNMIGNVLNNVTGYKIEYKLLTRVHQVWGNPYDNTEVCEYKRRKK